MWPNDTSSTASSSLDWNTSGNTITINTSTDCCTTNTTDSVWYVYDVTRVNSDQVYSACAGWGTRHHVPDDFEGPHEDQETREWAKNNDVYRKASHRARRLLLEHLSEEQLREYRVKRPLRRFFVTAPSGNQYMIENRRYGNVYKVENGEKVQCLCGHPQGAVPNEDTVLAQKLWLEAGMEELFFAEANEHHPSTWTREIAA